MLNKLKLMFYDLLFPVECLGCGRDGKYICKKCFDKIELRKEQLCLKCDKLVPNGLCRFCAKDFYLDGMMVVGDYDDNNLAKLIKTFKYRFVKELSHDLAQFLYKGWQFNIVVLENLLNLNKSLVMSVPLHKKRFKMRGFNQAELIARELSKELNLIFCNDLVRIKHKKPQAKLNRVQRLKNVVDVFDLADNTQIVGKSVILVDDIVTTGSTLSQCAKILKKRGVKKVIGLVLAKN